MDAVQLKLITEGELMALGSDARVEVVNGELVEMVPVGGLHHLVGGNIHDLFKTPVTKIKLGLVFFDGLIYLLHKEEGGIKGARVPDVSFIRKADIPADWDIEKPFPGAPTLAIEIMSPHDDPEDILERVRDYQRAGTEEVWVVYPRHKEIHQYQLAHPERVQVYRERDVIHMEHLLPGLTIAVADCFVMPDLH
jgi:Uma2 family endonuclease